MRLLFAFLASFHLCACATLGLGSEPPPEPPDYASDGFRAEANAGCQTSEACDALLKRAETRLAKCRADYDEYVLEATRRGYRFSRTPACPTHVEEEYDYVGRLAVRARLQERDASTSARPAPTASELDQEETEEAPPIDDELEARQIDAEVKRAVDQKRATELAAASEDARTGWAAASIRLCTLKDGLQELQADQQYERRVDAESGTIAPYRRRELAEDILDYKDSIACLTRAIRTKWKKAPAPCRDIDKLRDDSVEAILQASLIDAMENCE